MLKIRRVAVGISGGVDSAVAALFLKQKGYDVQGVFMQNWDIADETGHCTADADYKDASWVCDKLNIKLHHVNFVKQYWNEVFCNLLEEYRTGYTPNPDILCNKNMKFNHLYGYAINHLKADAIATGHYAKTSFGAYLENYTPAEGVRLFCADDSRKDQTYFLSQVKQEALTRTMFPLGNLTKQRVKQIAREHGLDKIADKKESMGICFIGTRNFQTFIREYISDSPGDFINIDDAKVAGKHNGIHQWTLGQRTRIPALLKAKFTAKKDPQTNVIYVVDSTKHPILHSDLIFTSQPHWIHSRPQELQSGDVLKCLFKFQHTERWVGCQVTEVDRGLVVKVEGHLRAVTPGQYGVFCKNGECLGSARIASSVSHFALFYLQNRKVLNVSDILNRGKGSRDNCCEETESQMLHCNK